MSQESPEQSSSLQAYKKFEEGRTFPDVLYLVRVTDGDAVRFDLMTDEAAAEALDKEFPVATYLFFGEYAPPKGATP
jgi:hypothetical protein